MQFKKVEEVSESKVKDFKLIDAAKIAHMLRGPIARRRDKSKEEFI